ncbi:MAG: DUF6273 domain-containing protein, partial [Lachnospiraceae bacterium]|nr:DUF6273 domain-containing protein [Lachnospiraceae bacterium]
SAAAEADAAEETGIAAAEADAVEETGTVEAEADMPGKTFSESEGGYTSSETTGQIDETVYDIGVQDTTSGMDVYASRQIADSWEEIIAAGEDGTYLEKYKIGDTKDLDLGEEGVIEIELVAFDADELADGSGKAHMTWIAKESLNSEHAINNNWYKKSNWLESDVRVWLQDSILPLFPEIVRSNVKEVTKYSYSCEDNGTVSSADKIWLPSAREIFGAECGYEDKGPEYGTVTEEL